MKDVADKIEFIRKYTKRWIKWIQNMILAKLQFPLMER
jgi:hypothetical protein